jgi:hypothetical protein
MNENQNTGENIMITQENKDTLESIIDGSTLADVLNAISEICYEKADHIRTNWQDANTAKVWEKAGKYVELSACKLDV